MRRFILRRTRNNRKGQATTEFAIMGALVLMLLGYLMQQGFIYNARQAMEMYTFRKALQLSREQERGIDLTVIRDVITPSFFSGLNRQRVMATTIIDHNAWKVWIPYAEDPEHTPTRKLIQINEGMLKEGYLFEIPPTKAKITSTEEDAKDDWKWINSPVSEIDPQTKPVKITQRTYEYTYNTKLGEDKQNTSIEKQLKSIDNIPTAITFERDIDKIKDEYEKDDWDNKIKSVAIDEDTIPKDIRLILDETVRRDKSATTPQQ